MPIHELITCCTPYHPQQTSATPHRAPELISVQCIGINIKTDIKKLNFNTNRLFAQRLRDKPEKTKLSIIIKYILSSNKQLSSVHTKLSYPRLFGPILI